MPDPATNPGGAKKLTKLPVWAYALAAVLGIVLVYFLSRPSKSAKASSDTGDGGLSPDVAAAQSGQPSQNFTGYEPPSNTDASGGGTGSGAVTPAVFHCLNNNRECPPLMHCHNATGTCVPWPTDDPTHLHNCQIGESTEACRTRLGLPTTNPTPA